MDALFAVGWSKYPSQDDNDLFDIYAISPSENFWYLNHKTLDRKVLLLKYVRKYYKLIQKHNKKHNLDFLEKLYNNNKFLKNTERILVGCIVNISALCSTSNKSFDINKILYKDPNGCLHPNRQRNVLVHICLRTCSPNIYSIEKINDFIKQYELETNKKLLNNNDRNSSNLKKKHVGDRVIRSSKTYNVPSSKFNKTTTPSSSNDINMTSKIMHPQQGSNSLFNLFTYQDKPRDQTYLTYPSGSAVLTGAKEPYMALLSQWTLANLFTIEGIPITFFNNFSIQNIVSTFRIPESIDLPRLEKVWGDDKIKYTSIKFPAAIYKPDETIIKIAMERANIIKKLRRKIVKDDSHKSQRTIEVEDMVSDLLKSYDAHKIKQNFKSKVSCKVNQIHASSSPNSSDNNNNQQYKPHDPDYIDDINDEIAKIIEKDISDILVISKPLLLKGVSKKNPVALIYRTGAIVITGSNDTDFIMALFEILYDMLMFFKNQCEEEDKKIADSYTNIINLEEKKHSTSSQLILMEDNKKKILDDKKRTIGVAPKGSLMRKMTLMAQVDHMKSITQKETYVETSKSTSAPIDKNKFIDFKKNNNNNKQTSLVISSSSNSSKRSSFSDIIDQSLNKKQRK